MTLILAREKQIWQINKKPKNFPPFSLIYTKKFLNCFKINILCIIIAIISYPAELFDTQVSKHEDENSRLCKKSVCINFTKSTARWRQHLFDKSTTITCKTTLTANREYSMITSLDCSQKRSDTVVKWTTPNTT